MRVRGRMTQIFVYACAARPDAIRIRVIGKTMSKKLRKMKLNFDILQDTFPNETRWIK